MNYYKRLKEPIEAGKTYRNGASEYLVESIYQDTACVSRPKDGWRCLIHSPALYETSDGIQLQWAYSSCGHWTRRAAEDEC